MLISRVSPMTGKVNTLDLNVTPEQINELNSPGRRLIQEIVPDLSNEEREFLLTGYTAEDWAKMFPKNEEDE